MKAILQIQQSNFQISKPERQGAVLSLLALLSLALAKPCLVHKQLMLNSVPFVRDVFLNHLTMDLSHMQHRVCIDLLTVWDVSQPRL